MSRSILFGISILFLVLVLTGCLQDAEPTIEKDSAGQAVDTQQVDQQADQQQQADSGIALPDSAAVAGANPPEDVSSDEKEVVEYEDEVEEKIDASLDYMTGAAVAGYTESDPRVADLVSSAGKISEMRYYLAKSPDIHIKSQVFVKGDKMKIILPEAPTFTRGKYYNTVYLDAKTKEAAAYCEDEKRCDDFNMKFDVKYEDYYRLTSRDWALFVPVDAEVLGTEVMFNRDVTLVQFGNAGKMYRVWLYNYHGLASKVVDSYGSPDAEVMLFELISTHVSDSQVEHQYADR